MTNFSNNFDEVSNEMSQQTSTSHEMGDFLIDTNDVGENAGSASEDAFVTNVGTQREPTVGDLDLEVRSSLHRLTRSVIHTESEEAMVKYRQLRLERMVLLGAWASGTLQEVEVMMEELAIPAETADSEVLEMALQCRDKPDPGTYMGSDKLNELRDIAAPTGADTVICGDKLSPDQLVALGDRLDAKVIDRTMLTLDIFARRAKSKEGKAQVSLAQMQYLYTHPHGWGGNLPCRAGGHVGSSGGVGLRDPGETKIETDRRRLHRDMVRIRRELVGMKTAHGIRRAHRKARYLPHVAIIGYTNTDKSSLLNALTDTGVLVEDALFVMLDPTTRRIKLRGGRTVVMTDTIGFVRHLPTQLIEAFRSTLEEVLETSAIIHVIGPSDPFPLDQIKAINKVVSEVTEEGKAETPPELLVVNKADEADGITLARLRHQLDDMVFVPVRTGEGIGELEIRLRSALNELESHVHMLIPYSKGDTVSMLHEDAIALSGTWTEQDIQMGVRLSTSLADELSAYHIEPAADIDFTVDANEESSIDS